MYPELFHISFLHTYGVLVAFGFLAGLWMAGRLGARAGLNAEHITNLGLYCALAALAGAKVMMLAVDAGYYWEHPDRIFSLETLQAGGVFYGGLLGALAVAAWYLHKTRLPGLMVADAFAPAIALGHAIGRIGCFTAGCCWGTVCHLPWAVTFTNPVANQLVGVPLDVPLHPAQLYESAAEFAIFGILYWRFGRPHGRGDIISMYLMLYCAARFVVEFFREHQQGNLWGTPLDASQWISIVLFAAGAAHFVIGKHRAKRAAGARG
ncbi:MAG: prolipoprotein diacylglyceryl transferase [Bryobacteraceae bacterium]|jgi:phosphatidylglycerol:prolipoprotein diacylglycerol transferase